MINYSINGNELIVNNNIVNFKYPIFKAENYKDLIIVLLKFENSYNPKEFFNTIYAISSSGNITWQMEKVSRVLGKYEPDPLINFVISENSIVAIDFCSRKYTLDPNNGVILDLKTGTW